MQKCLECDTIEPVAIDEYFLIYLEGDDMNENQSTVIKLDPDIGRRFKLMCVARGIAMKDVTAELILNWIAENTPPTGIAGLPTGRDTATQSLPLE